MTSVDRTYTVRRDGERLDKICKAELGTERGGAVESVLNLNPGLAALGITLPLGTKIKLPPRPSNESKRPVVKRIWGES
ncbi:tail protein X [Rhodopseudomonas sp. BR0G17]|uniref:tail protein X n=1 Tax=Rhodopseudomonas sp. BR0G17 TaxID=2269368 RepID=UPI0013E0B713|nr:tail protein X [Rhodopseudomonas sp. BR0G17]NEW96901.1 phage tail protein [Rhodopseudomonas sp. BR0G17]